MCTKTEEERSDSTIGDKTEEIIIRCKFSNLSATVDTLIEKYNAEIISANPYPEAMYSRDNIYSDDWDWNVMAVFPKGGTFSSALKKSFEDEYGGMQ